MRLVKDTNIPHRCAVIPGRCKDPDGFISTGMVLTGWDQHVEISAAGARELGRIVGMRPKEDFEELEVKVHEMAVELVAVKQRLEDVTQLRELEQKVTEPVAA
jgi:hypothetical protein